MSLNTRISDLLEKKWIPWEEAFKKKLRRRTILALFQTIKSLSALISSIQTRRTSIMFTPSWWSLLNKYSPTKLLLTKPFLKDCLTKLSSRKVGRSEFQPLKQFQAVSITWSNHCLSSRKKDTYPTWKGLHSNKKSWKMFSILRTYHYAIPSTC